MKKIVVLTGAGISAESGIQTFRDGEGLWNQYRFEDLATPEAFNRDPELVLEFYNWRRKKVWEAKPNAAHLFVAELQNHFDVHVVTQNVDDLHERAGSKNVLHLHGEIMKARSTADESLIYPVTKLTIKKGDLCQLGSQLRPHIVWFGEMVPEMDKANLLANNSDIFIVIGTSLNVYPAAGVVNYVPAYAPTWVLDPGDIHLDFIREFHHIKKTAVNGVEELRKELFKLL